MIREYPRAKYRESILQEFYYRAHKEYPKPKVKETAMQIISDKTKKIRPLFNQCPLSLSKSNPYLIHVIRFRLIVLTFV